MRAKWANPWLAMNIVGFDFNPKRKRGPYLFFVLLSFGSKSKTVSRCHMDIRRILKSCKIEGPGGRGRLFLVVLVLGLVMVSPKRNLRVVRMQRRMVKMKMRHNQVSMFELTFLAQISALNGIQLQNINLTMDEDSI